MEEALLFLKRAGVDWMIVLLYWLAGTFTSTFFTGVWKLPYTTKCVSPTWRTLFVGSAIVFIWVYITYGHYSLWTIQIKQMVFVSYIFTTSLYETFLKGTINKFIWKYKEKWFGKEEKEKPKTDE